MTPGGFDLSVSLSVHWLIECLSRREWSKRCFFVSGRSRASPPSFFFTKYFSRAIARSDIKVSLAQQVLIYDVIIYYVHKNNGGFNLAFCQLTVKPPNLMRHKIFHVYGNKMCMIRKTLVLAGDQLCMYIAVLFLISSYCNTIRRS